MLPFEPEPEKSLKARFQEALEDRFDMQQVEDGLIERPGLIRKHVFDFQDGLRLIVSNDKSGNNYYMHISASVDLSVSEHSFDDLQEFVSFVLGHVNRLNGKPITGAVRIMTTEKGIVHLMIPQVINLVIN